MLTDTCTDKDFDTYTDIIYNLIIYPIGSMYAIYGNIYQIYH